MDVLTEIYELLLLFSTYISMPRLTHLTGIPPPLHIVQNKEQCLSKRASWVLPGVNANCGCGSIGLGTITVGSFIIPCSILHKMKFNVSLSIRRLSLNSSFVQVSYPSRQSFFCSSQSRFGIFCFFGRFWTVCKISCVTLPTVSSSSPPLVGKKTSESPKHSSSSIFLFLALFFIKS